MADKVRARWVGQTSVTIPGTGVSLSPGDEYLVYPHEVYGQTTWTNPRNSDDAWRIGIGHVVKPEHAGIPRPALEEMGYRFEEKSANWEPVEAFDPAAFQSTPEAQAAQMDLSAFFVQPQKDSPAEEAAPELEAHKDEGGTITITTTLPPEPVEPDPSDE